MKRWQRKDLGYVCEPYRIGPFVLPDSGALCTVWRLRMDHELIGEYADEYEAMKAAREHADGMTAGGAKEAAEAHQATVEHQGPLRGPLHGPVGLRSEE